VTDWNLVDAMSIEWNEHLSAMQYQFEMIKIYNQPPKLTTKLDLIKTASRIKELLDQAIEETCKN